MMDCPGCAAGLPASPAFTGSDRLHGVPGRFGVHVCGMCGSARTSPRVESTELGSLYPPAYNAYVLPGPAPMRLMATALFRARYGAAMRSAPLASLPASGAVLDVGSGRGDLGVVMARRGVRLVGLEPSPEAVRVSRERGVKTVEGTLTSVDRISGAPFDAAVFQHSLEHVVEPAEDLRRLGGLLAPGGLALISLPNFGSWQAREYGPDWFHLDLPRHRSHLTPEGLRALLERTGFTPMQITTSTSPDGLPNSAQYRHHGRRRFDSGPGLVAATGASILAQPIVAQLDRTRGGGDFLHAVGRRRDP